MTTDEKDVFIELPNSIVTWKTIVLVNYLNTFVREGVADRQNLSDFRAMHL